MDNSKLYEVAAIVATIDPQDAADTVKTSDYVYASKFTRLGVIVKAGAQADGGTITVFKSDDGSGTNKTTIATATVPASGDNCQWFFDVDVTSLGTTRPYVAVQFSGASSGVNMVDATILAYRPRYAPVNTYDLASVTLV